MAPVYRFFLNLSAGGTEDEEMRVEFWRICEIYKKCVNRSNKLNYLNKKFPPLLNKNFPIFFHFPCNKNFFIHFKLKLSTKENELQNRGKLSIE